LAETALITERLRKAEFLLSVPRLHHEYIQKNGVNPFIEKFNIICAEYKNIIEENELAQKRRE
jgi:hypothetical protein